MREQACEQCGKTYGLNELASIFGTTLCQPCGEAKLENYEQSQITEETVYALSDPTICARCGTDGGDREYEQFLEMPICGSCNDAMVNYRYPTWVKAFFAGVLIVTIFSVFWNFRFFQARMLMEQAIRGDSSQISIDISSKKMSKAADLVPESQELRTLSHYLGGIHNLQIDNCQTALEHFQQCRELPQDYGVQNYLLYAESGASFDNGDYQKFLEVSLKICDSNPNDSISEGQVASAYACLYAKNAQAEYKEKALEHLQKAEEKTTPQDRVRFEDYRERILYRLETRRIIKREEYYKETGKTPPEDLG